MAELVAAPATKADGSWSIPDAAFARILGALRPLAEARTAAMLEAP